MTPKNWTLLEEGDYIDIIDRLNEDDWEELWETEDEAIDSETTITNDFD